MWGLRVMMPYVIEVNAEKASAVNNRPRNLISHPAPPPSIGTDQDADCGGIFDAFTDQAFDSLIAFQLAAFPQAAVLKAPHEGIVRVIDLPRIADHVHAHDVVVVKREERVSLHRWLEWPDRKPWRRQ